MGVIQSLQCYIMSLVLQDFFYIMETIQKCIKDIRHGIQASKFRILYVKNWKESWKEAIYSLFIIILVQSNLTFFILSI